MRSAFLRSVFVRSGYVYTNGGEVHFIGNYLYNWSRVISSASGAYDLGVIPTEVHPSANDNRFYGFPLRCLYLGSV